MIKEGHFFYYLSILVTVVIGIILIIHFSPDRNFQLLSVIGVSISYVVIGIIHHLINHDLVAKIVIEYILIAGFGVTASYFIFKGGFGI